MSIRGDPAAAPLAPGPAGVADQAPAVAPPPAAGRPVRHGHEGGRQNHETQLNVHPRLLLHYVKKPSFLTGRIDVGVSGDAGRWDAVGRARAQLSQLLAEQQLDIAIRRDPNFFHTGSATRWPGHRHRLHRHLRDRAVLAEAIRFRNHRALLVHPRVRGLCAVAVVDPRGWFSAQILRGVSR